MSAVMEWVAGQPLTPARKLVLGALVDRAGYGGDECHFELAVISHLASQSERYVVESLKVFAEAGLITLLGDGAQQWRPSGIKLHFDVTASTVDGRRL
jgi:hypothetical protein